MAMLDSYKVDYITKESEETAPLGLPFQVTSLFCRCRQRIKGTAVFSNSIG